MANTLSFDVAAFYNQYGDLRSAALGAAASNSRRRHRIIVQTTTPDNSVKAHTHGVEIARRLVPAALVANSADLQLPLADRLVDQTGDPGLAPARSSTTAATRSINGRCVRRCP
jgi:hypothetical protein